MLFFLTVFTGSRIDMTACEFSVYHKTLGWCDTEEVGSIKLQELCAGWGLHHFKLDRFEVFVIVYLY